MFFEDRPGSEAAGNPQKEYKMFRTELVGVRIDSFGVRTEVATGLGFTYRSNLRYVEGSVIENHPGLYQDGAINQIRRFIDVYDSSFDFLPVLDGGISDVSVFRPMPEPTTLFLLGMSAITLIGYRKEKSHG
jgi:hypothetical protein